MWQKMERATPLPSSDDPEIIAKILADHVRSGRQMWKNDLYTVTERRQRSKGTGGNVLVHLSIHRNDREAIHDWRHLQLIKNDIIGPGEEAVEIYPAESRLVDTSNEYHIWSVLGCALPFGYDGRLVSDGGYDLGSKQRLWEQGDRPTDVRDISKEELLKVLEETDA